MSTTPPSISDPTELARVLSHYDTGVIKRIEPIRRGVGNSVKWAVACEKGPFLLKRRPVGVDEPLLALIQMVQMEASRTGFPVPEVVPVRGPGGSTGGALLLRLDGRLYELNRFVKSTGFDQSPAACRAAGAMLGRLHGVLAKMVMPPTAPGVNAGTQSGTRGYHRLLRVQTELVQMGDRLKAASGSSDARKIARHLGEMYTLASERAASAGVEKWPLQLTHGDWHPGNLLFDGAAPGLSSTTTTTTITPPTTIVGLIDFDSVRPSPRVLDVAYGVLQFSMIRAAGPAQEWPAAADLDRARAFVNGYDSDAPALLSREEASSLNWLMIEALIAEASGPLAATGEFGGVDGLSMARFIENKSAWLRDHQAEIAGLVGGG
ncbi:MAG: phosphotransferase enzyme family protein [Phycisphaerales bacterium]